jgi:hypothetical protein
MAAILTMCQCSSEELSFETLEMADNFSISVPERTGYTFPVSVPYL